MKSYSIKEDLKVWTKEYIEHTHPDSELTAKRVSTAILLGFDVSRNNEKKRTTRYQGSRWVFWDDSLKQGEINYRTYDEIELNEGRTIYTRNKKQLKVYISPSISITKHYNSQSKRSKNYKIKKYNDCLPDKLNKDLWKIQHSCLFSRYPYTKVIAIDIDCHKPEDKNDAITAFKFICTNYYDNILYAEISQNNGYHIFLQVNEFLNQEKLKKFQQYFKDLDFNNVDIIGANNEKQLLQYIDSPQYHPISVDRTGYITAITESVYTDFVLKFQLNSKHLTISDLCRVRKPRVISNLEEKVKQAEEYKENSYVSIFGNRKDIKTKFTSKDKIIQNLKIKYPYGAGERVQMMKTIASACLFYSLTKEEFVEICLANDQGSKDLKRWSKATIERIYFKYYTDFCLIVDKGQDSFKYSIDSFISNLYLIDANSYLKIRVNEFSNVFSNSYLSTLKYDKWKSEYKSIIPILISEIIGSFLYDQLHPKQRNKKSTLTQKKFNSIVKSFQITSKWKEQFKSQYNCKIDINKLVNLIMNNTIFKQIFLNKSGYCFNPKYSYSKLFKLKEYRHNSIINNIIRNIIIYILSIYKQIKNIICIKFDFQKEQFIYNNINKLFDYG